MREDTPAMTKTIVAAMDAAWAWLSSPPLWATCLALMAVTIAYVANLLGSDRLIRFSKHIFLRDARVAEYKLISEDEDLNRLHLASVAFDINKRIIWEMPQFPEPGPITGHLGDDLRQQETLLAHANEMRLFTNGLDNASGLNLSQALTARAQGKAAAVGSRWNVTNGVFASDDRRAAFNEAYAQYRAIELTLPEIRQAIAAIANDWFPAPLNSANGFSQRLLDKIVERLP